MHRMVNGERVELSPEEENELRASWVAPAPEVPSPRDAAIDALIAERAKQPNPPSAVVIAAGDVQVDIVAVKVQ